LDNAYDHNFYSNRHRATVYSATTVLAIVLDALPAVRSAVDFGCGVGTWLSVLKERGVEEILGLDGPWVEKELLEIPASDFRETIFEGPTALDKRYDLALTLEVAEHLSPESAAGFVDSLTNASDFVLFSAAIPSQDGTGHVNEQWQDYWVGLFKERGYATFDFVRGSIWRDSGIPVWYRQNILFFAKQERVNEVRAQALDDDKPRLPISFVHPEMYLSKITRQPKPLEPSIKESWRHLRRAFKNRLKRQILKSASGPSPNA